MINLNQFKQMTTLCESVKKEEKYSVELLDNGTKANVKDEISGKKWLAIKVIKTANGCKVVCSGDETLPDGLVKSVEKEFCETMMESADESLEHAIGDYFYDRKVGKYYHKPSDIYVDNDEVDAQYHARHVAVQRNNYVLKELVKLDIIPSNLYSKMYNSVSWDEEKFRPVADAAKKKGIDIYELFVKAREEIK